MTFNIHSLLHVVESVRKNGPLWSNSAFPLEGNIYHLKKNVMVQKEWINKSRKNL